jgi:hypothetical protein
MDVLPLPSYTTSYPAQARSHFEIMLTYMLVITYVLTYRAS